MKLPILLSALSTIGLFTPSSVYAEDGLESAYSSALLSRHAYQGPEVTSSTADSRLKRSLIRDFAATPSHTIDEIREGSYALEDSIRHFAAVAKKDKEEVEEESIGSLHDLVNGEITITEDQHASEPADDDVSDLSQKELRLGKGLQYAVFGISLVLCSVFLALGIRHLWLRRNERDRLSKNAVATRMTILFFAIHAISLLIVFINAMFFKRPCSYARDVFSATSSASLVVIVCLQLFFTSRRDDKSMKEKTSIYIYSVVVFFISVLLQYLVNWKVKDVSIIPMFVQIPFNHVTVQDAARFAEFFRSTFGGSSNDSLSSRTFNNFLIQSESHLHRLTFLRSAITIIYAVALVVSISFLCRRHKVVRTAKKGKTYFVQTSLLIVISYLSFLLFLFVVRSFFAVYLFRNLSKYFFSINDTKSREIRMAELLQTEVSVRHAQRFSLINGKYNFTWDSLATFQLIGTIIVLAVLGIIFFLTRNNKGAQTEVGKRIQGWMDRFKDFVTTCFKRKEKEIKDEEKKTRKEQKKAKLAQQVAQEQQSTA